MIPLASWPRSRFVAGGGDARVCFEVCGQFPAQLNLSDSYHTAGVPEGVELRVAANEGARFGPQLEEVLRESNPQLWPTLERAPQMVQLIGAVRDPDNLDYLRDCLGLIAALLEQGGAGVIDPQTMQTFSPAQWRETFWSGAFEPTSHAVILMSPEAGGTIWLHTRGMRLFGRPDLSCQGVRPDEIALLQPVFNGLMRMMAAGALVPDGQIVAGVGLDLRLICRHDGNAGDPNDNARLQLRWEGRDS